MKGSNRRTFPMTVSDRTTVGSFAASDGAPPTPSAVFRAWECGTSRSTILTNRVSDDGLQLRPMPSPSPPSASPSPPCYAMRVTAVNATAAIVQVHTVVPIALETIPVGQRRSIAVCLVSIARHARAHLTTPVCQGQADSCLDNCTVADRGLASCTQRHVKWRIYPISPIA